MIMAVNQEVCILLPKGTPSFLWLVGHPHHVPFLLRSHTNTYTSQHKHTHRKGQTGQDRKDRHNTQDRTAPNSAGLDKTEQDSTEDWTGQRERDQHRQTHRLTTGTQTNRPHTFRPLSVRRGRIQEFSATSSL